MKLKMEKFRRRYLPLNYLLLPERLLSLRLTSL